MKAFKIFLSLVVLFILSLAFILFNGCGNNVTSYPGNLSLSFSNGQQMAKTKSDTLIISSAKILLKNLEVIKTGNDTTNKEIGKGDDWTEDDEAVELKYGPFVVPLNLNGGINTITVNNVPAGTYIAAEFLIHEPTENETPPDSDFTDSSNGNNKYSIIVKGTYNSIPFVFKSMLSAKQKVMFQNPITVSSNNFINVTLVVNPYSWFSLKGRILNPLNLSDGIIINGLIKTSFREGFEDNNEDGHKD